MNTHRATGWYCDATPLGLYAYLVPGQYIVADGGIVPLPGGNLDCLVLSLHGWIAGSVQRGKQDFAVAWDGTAWIELGATVGRNACAFSVDGMSLYVCRGGTVSIYTLPSMARFDVPFVTGSLGIRTVTEDGRIVTCESTYNEPTHTLFEFTDLPGVTVGHGNDGVGCLVRLDDGVVRMLEAGEAKFVQAHRFNNLIAVAFHREDTREAVFYWLNLSDVAALPPLAAPAPNPNPAPIPVPNPEAPTMTFTQIEKALLVEFAKAFPLPQAANETPEAISAWEAQRRAWTYKAAQTFKARVGGWGTKRADPNRPPSKDALAKEEGGRLWGFDTCVATSETTIGLNVDAHGEDITGQVFIPVEARDWLAGIVPGPVTPPVTPPGPVTPPVPQQPTEPADPNPIGEIIGLSARVAQLEATVGRLVAWTRGV